MRPVDLARKLKVSQPNCARLGKSIARHHAGPNVRRRRVRAKTCRLAGLCSGADEEAERVAQSAVELAFLRLYREYDDAAQASLLRLMTAMPRAASSPATTPPPPKERPAPSLDRGAGSVIENSETPETAPKSCI